MHTEMWEHPATQANVATLRVRGAVILGPASGELAGGDVGSGRMLEPDDIVAALEIDRTGPLAGKRVLVSAGGTREAIDPVRYIGNRSSGKMGHAVAAEARLMGADVVLVTTQPEQAPEGVEVLGVETAQEMAEVVWTQAVETDLAVLAAAVADYRPANPATDKLRRSDGPPEIALEATPDILAGVVAAESGPVVVGFAAEVGSTDGAVEKARSKGVDFLVGNDVAKAGSGFGTETNEVVFVRADGSSEAWPLLSKSDVARRLLTVVAEAL